MRIEKSYNPLVVGSAASCLTLDEAISPNQMIERGVVVLSRPTILLVNGECRSRKDWDYPVPITSTCRFVELPRGGNGGSNPLRIIVTILVIVASYYTGGAAGAAYGAIVGSIVSSVVMIAGSLLMNAMFPVGGSPDAQKYFQGVPVNQYSIGSGSNQLRIGQPYAEHFGRMVIYPDLAQVSYTRNESNEQYLYFLGFLGIGEFEIESVNINDNSIQGVFIHDTPILDYTGTAFNILPPGTPPSICTEIVWQSTAVNGQQLCDIVTNTKETGVPNQPLVLVVSAPGTMAHHIEYDISFNALFHADSYGNPGIQSCSIYTQVRRVDSVGNPLGSWLYLDAQTYTYASIDPLRFSHKCPVPDGVGRYEFRIWRSALPTHPEHRDACNIIGLKAYGGIHPVYEGVTMIECKIKATYQLSGEVANRINVIATRKLQHVTAGGLTLDKTPTRSIVDACAYIVTSPNGGNQPVEALLYSNLADIRGHLASYSYLFDWRFTTRKSVMDSCTQAAQCGKCIPYMPSGLFSLAMDGYQELPTMVFNDDDFDADSLMITNAFRTEGSSTCFTMAYTNPDSWQREEIDCYDEGGSLLTPNSMTLSGCSSRQHAYEIGMYLYRDDSLNRTTVEFTTGLKGHLPSLFSKILVANTSTDWGQTGKISSVIDGIITVTEPLEFKGETEGKMYISGKNGKAEGPYVVLPTDSPYQVSGEIANDVRTVQTDDIKASSFVFGPSSIDPLFLRVMGITPQGRNKVKITGSIINDAVYDFPGYAPPIQSLLPEATPLSALNIFSPSVYNYSLTWFGSSTTFKIEMDDGTGYVTLHDNYVGYSTSFSSEIPTMITARVTPYVDGVLASDQALTASIVRYGAVTGLVLDSLTNDEIAVSWDALPRASRYDIRILVGGDYVGGLSTGGFGKPDATIPSISIPISSLVAIGGPWPDFTVAVAAVVGDSLGDYSFLEIIAPSMAAPSIPILQQITFSGVVLSWGTVSNASGYEVYMGSTVDFDPSTDGALVYSGTTPSALVATSVHAPYDYFFKVAATNVYYRNVADLVFSSALEVSHA